MIQIYNFLKKKSSNLHSFGDERFRVLPSKNIQRYEAFIMNTEDFETCLLVY